MEELRSIDTAHNATIDLMTLNKKIVNMRAIVRRSKTHIINKLTRSIADLKQKKGTEQKKEKNLKKAQRHLHELNSIRSLKEDKIAKYSLANVSTFQEVSKSTESSAARALARLADHHYIKDAVLKFREEHSDWRDLAAFMLMQQTGRKFKSQKQQKKKIVSRAENINASKLMTQAYTQGLFRDGEDGFKNADGPFENKRKKELENTSDADAKQTQLSVSSADKISNTKGVSNNLRKRMLNNADECVKENKKEVSNQRLKDRKTEDTGKRKEGENILEKNKSNEATACDGHEDESLNTIYQVKQIVDKDSEEYGVDEEEMEVENDDSDSGSAEESGEESSVESEEEAQREDENSPQLPEKSEEPKKKISKKDKECVVKQLNIGSKSDESGSESEDDELVSSDDGDAEEEEDSERDSSDNVPDDSEEEEETKVSKRSKKRNAVTDLLTQGEKNLHKLPRDSFFEGSDNEVYDSEDEYDDKQPNVSGEEEDNEDYENHEKLKGNKRTTKSLFHKPGDEKRNKLYEKKDFSQHARRNDGVDSGRGGRGRGGSKDRGRGRGGGFRGGRGSGGSFSESRGRGGRGNSFRGGRGNSFGEGRGRGSKTWQKYGKDFKTKKDDSGSGSGRLLPEAATKDSKPTEKLHPSWEASRKRKAEQSGGIRAFSGTKITFDD